MSDKFDISILENNIIVNQIINIEKHDVYNSIPRYIFQNTSWSILSKQDVDIRLDLMSSRTTIGQNRQKLAFLVLSRIIPEIISVAVSEPQSVEEQMPVKVDPFHQCLHRTFKTIHKYFNAFIKTYIVNYDDKDSN
jgi:hypothetical protein